jgi:hypothetical protein
MSPVPPALRVEIVQAERLELVHRTHLLNLGEHLFPRTLEDFEKLVEEQELFELRDVSVGANAVPAGSATCVCRPTTSTSSSSTSAR